MNELRPTAENLRDPYVLQLIGALAKMDDRVEELEALFIETDADCADKEDRIGVLEADVIRITEIANINYKKWQEQTDRIAAVTDNTIQNEDTGQAITNLQIFRAALDKEQINQSMSREDKLVFAQLNKEQT